MRWYPDVILTEILKKKKQPKKPKQNKNEWTQ